MSNPITTAILGAIGAPAPAHTVTVTWANGSRATYSASMLDMLKTDPAAIDIQDDTTGELVYINPATREQQPTETENAPQAATQAAEGTEEEKEAEPMTTTERAATAAEAATVAGIIRRQGGYRERDILTHPHEMTHGETWSAEHKVIHITETTPDPDGHRASCAVDIVARSIVG